MSVSVFRVANGWAVRTSHTELLCASIHDAMSAAAKYAQARDYAEADRRGWHQQDQ